MLATGLRELQLEGRLGITRDFRYYLRSERQGACALAYRAFRMSLKEGRTMADDAIIRNLDQRIRELAAGIEVRTDWLQAVKDEIVGIALPSEEDAIALMAS